MLTYHRQEVHCAYIVSNFELHEISRITKGIDRQYSHQRGTLQFVFGSPFESLV